MTGGDVANDDTIVCRNDTYGAYVWTPGGSSWTQMMTTSSMVLNTDAGLDANGEYIVPEMGCYEVAIAPSNSSRIYCAWNGYVYRTDNKGAGWTRTAFSHVTFGDLANHFLYRMNGPHMRVHPTDPDTCVIGTQSDGAFYTTNGGTSWTAVSGVLSPTTNGPAMFVQFDPNNGSTVYIGSDGRGVYQSTTGVSGTFSLTTSGPTTFQSMLHDKFSRLWVCSGRNGVAAGSNNTWKFVSGSWTNFGVGGSFPQQVHCIVSDPNNTNNLFAAIDSGDIYTSTNAGGAWSAPTAQSGTRGTKTGEPGWQASTQTLENYMSNGNMLMLSTGRMIFFEGIGNWYSDTPSTTTTWTPMSRGLENLVVNKIISPPAGTLVVGCWDRPVFNCLDKDTYPAKHGLNYSQSIMHGWSVDYAKTDPTFIVCHATDNGGNGGGGFSSNGGSTWTLFTTQPGAASIYGGGIAARNTTDFVVIHGQTPTNPRFTNNGGSTWATSTVSGVSGGWQGSNNLHRQIITCDANGDFYAYNEGSAAPGVYKSTDRGANFSLVSSGRLHGGSAGGIDAFNAQLEAVPGASFIGQMCFTAGDIGGSVAGSFLRCTNSGVTWTAVSGVTEVKHFGFGKAKPSGGGHPAVYIVGWVGGTATTNYGVWRSDDFEQSTPTWTRISTYPLGWSGVVTSVCGDMNTYGLCYVGYRTAGAAYIQS